CRGHDAGLRLSQREERDVWIPAGDRLDHRARRCDRDDARATAQRGPCGEEDRAGITQRAADDEDAAPCLLTGVFRQWLERRAYDASIERSRRRPLGQRSPTATATARSRMCDIDTDRGVLIPIACRRASARP